MSRKFGHSNGTQGTNDGTQQQAKPSRHEDTRQESKSGYEHPQITDNRLVWEVLEDE